MLSHFLAHPLPEALDRIEIGAIARKRDQLDAKVSRCDLGDRSAMTGGSVPNEDDATGRRADPFNQAAQELGGMLPLQAPSFQMKPRPWVKS